jgi:hypothetical protein
MCCPTLQVEYAVLESRQDRVVTITLLRDLNVYAGAMVVEYATSDLTAQGVDTAQYEACMLMAPQLRPAAGCGDYEHSSGVVIFAAGAGSAGFTVRIVDDVCRERFMEYIQVSHCVVLWCCTLVGKRLLWLYELPLLTALSVGAVAYMYLPYLYLLVSGDYLRTRLSSAAGREAVGEDPN